MFRDECRRIVPGWWIFRARRDEIYAARGVITQLRLYPHYRSAGVTPGVPVTGRKFTGGYVARNWILRLVIKRILPSRCAARHGSIPFVLIAYLRRIPMKRSEFRARRRLISARLYRIYNVKPTDGDVDRAKNQASAHTRKPYCK